VLLVGLLLALPVTAVAAGVVYADAARRGLPLASRLRWTAGVSAGSLAGFSVAFGLASWLFRAVHSLTGSPGGAVVVVSPVELVTTLSAAALAVSAAAVLAYGFGSRWGPLAAA
jgi:hypothetical protein